MFKQNKLIRISLYFSAVTLMALATSGCSDDEDVVDTPNGKIDVNAGIDGTRIDRVGRPGISTVPLAKEVATLSGDDLPTEADKDYFNQSSVAVLSGDTAPASALRSKMGGVLDVLYSLGSADLVVNGVALSDATLKAVLIDEDVLKIDVDGTTTNYLGVEVGLGGSFGGRALAADVVDTSLTALTRQALVTDKVGENDKAFSNDFPYLASAN